MTTASEKKDLEVLRSLADYRMLTQGQIASLLFDSYQGPRRSLKRLGDERLLEVRSQSWFRSMQGGRESIYSVSEKGVKWLQDSGMLPGTIAVESVVTEKMSRLTGHQLLLNWVRIHLSEIPKHLRDLRVDFLASNSPFSVDAENGMPLLLERQPDIGAKGVGSEFIPDGAFAIQSKRHNMALLFFLEVDMGTEPLSRGKNGGAEIRQKIANYQWYFQQNRYKRYERIFHAPLSGFRLLFVVPDDATRMQALCGLVREMHPSDFIWVSSENEIFEHGISDRIWLRSGRMDLPSESILGPTMATSLPIPLEKRKP